MDRNWVHDVNMISIGIIVMNAENIGRVMFGVSIRVSVRVRAK